MADQFTPPPVSSWEGPASTTAPAQQAFTPPPISSWEGPAQKQPDGGAFSRFIQGAGEGSGISTLWSGLKHLTGADDWSNAYQQWTQGNHAAAIGSLLRAGEPAVSKLTGDYANISIDQAQKASQAAKDAMAGNPQRWNDALTHTMGALLPPAAPAADVVDDIHQGNYAGALGKVTGLAAGLAAGEGLAKFGAARSAGTEAGMEAATKRSQSAARPQGPQPPPLPHSGQPASYLENVATGNKLATINDVLDHSIKVATQALSPAAGEPFARDMDIALPIVKQEETLPPPPGSTRENSVNRPIGAVPNRFGVVGRSGLGRLVNRMPDIDRLRDSIGATLDAMARKREQYDMLYRDPAMEAGIKVQASDIPQAVMDSLPEEMKRRYAPALGGMQAELNRLYPQGEWYDASQLEAKRAELNAKLRKINNQPASEQAAGERTIPQQAQWQAEADAIRDKLYEMIGNGDQTGPRQLMREWGSLRSLFDAQNYAYNTSMGFEPGGLNKASPFYARAAAQAKMGEIRGAVSNFSTGTMRGITPKAGPGQLMQDAFRNIKVPPAPAPTARPFPKVGPGEYPLQLGPGGPPGQGPLPGRGPMLGPPPGGGVVPTGPGGTWSMQGAPALPTGLQLPSGPSNLPTGPIQQLPPPPAARGITVVGMPAAPKPPKAPAGPALPKPPKAEVQRQKILNIFRGHKQRLDRQFVGMAKKNKIASYGVPPGVLTDAQQGQYNAAVKTLEQQQNQQLAQIPPDIAPAGPPVMPPEETPPNVVGAIPAAKGNHVQGPTPVVVGEPGPERIDHSDGRPSEVVNGTQIKTLGTNGPDRVVPLTKFPEKGIIRGSANIPLSEEGKQHAVRLGQQLAQAGGLDLIRSSDLSRTRETAQALAQATGAQLAPPTPGLRSWSLGDLEGQPATDQTDALIQHHINAAPDTPLPGQGPVSVQPGESFNTFKQRVLATLAQVKAEWGADPRKRIALVTHNRDEKLIRASEAVGNGGKDIDKRIMAEPGGEPGSMMQMVPVGGGRWRVVPFDPKVQATGPGIYLCRHTESGWNAPNEAKAGGS